MHRDTTLSIFRGGADLNKSTLHPTPYTLHTTHYTLHTTQYTLHTTHYSLHTTFYTLGVQGATSSAK